jgi:hypothetical protein
VFFFPLKTHVLTHIWLKILRKHYKYLYKLIHDLKKLKNKNLLKLKFVFLGNLKVKLKTRSPNETRWNQNWLSWWPKSMSTMIYSLYCWNLVTFYFLSRTRN